MIIKFSTKYLIIKTHNLLNIIIKYINYEILVSNVVLVYFNGNTNIHLLI